VPVIDATQVVTTAHQDHDHAHVVAGIETAWSGRSIEDSCRSHQVAAGGLHTGHGAAVTAYRVFVTWLVPISPRVYYDPAMQYMLSSLALFRGTAYHCIDHPGTPVEMLGTLLLALTYPFVGLSTGSLIAFHLSHPDVFMSIAQTLLLMGTLVTCALLRLGHCRLWTIGARPSPLSPLRGRFSPSTRTVSRHSRSGRTTRFLFALEPCSYCG